MVKRVRSIIENVNAFQGENWYKDKNYLWIFRIKLVINRKINFKNNGYK